MLAWPSDSLMKYVSSCEMTVIKFNTFAYDVYGSTIRSRYRLLFYSPQVNITGLFIISRLDMPTLSSAVGNK